MSYSATMATQEKTHAAPCSNRDFDFYYEGLEQGQLLVQRCAGCGLMRNPPGPCCPACRSLQWDTVPLKGTGSIYSWTVHCHPPLPDFTVPHPVALVELDEGLRMVGAMDGVTTPLAIGQRVRAEFVRRGKVAGFRFVPDAR
jgi:uncharacterized OB-fold protein